MATVDEVLIKIDKQTSQATAKRILTAVTDHVQAEVSPYPPETFRNRPGGGRYSWYVRGYGTRTRTGRAYRTSENFLQAWRVEKRSTFETRLKNNASYGGYLKGDKQVGWAKVVGWSLVKDDIKKAGPEMRRITAAIIRQVNRA